MKQNNTLTKLYLSNNKIGDVGAKAIAIALETNISLTTIYLSNNKIGHVGAKAIADALKINKELKIEIFLKNNKLISPKTKTGDTRLIF